MSDAASYNMCNKLNSVYWEFHISVNYITVCTLRFCITRFEGKFLIDRLVKWGIRPSLQKVGVRTPVLPKITPMHAWPDGIMVRGRWIALNLQARRQAVPLSGNNFRQVVHTHVPSSIIWYQSSDALLQMGL